MICKRTSKYIAYSSDSCSRNSHWQALEEGLCQCFIMCFIVQSARCGRVRDTPPLSSSLSHVEITCGLV